MSFHDLQTALEAGCQVLGAVSVFATVLSRVVPWKPVAAFMARLGVTTGKFKVEAK